MKKIIEWLLYYFLPRPYLSLSSGTWGGAIIGSFDEMISILRAEFEDEEEDMQYHLELVFMTENQKEKLPEFDGW
jgi:hypothetical protein